VAERTATAWDMGADSHAIAMVALYSRRVGPSGRERDCWRRRCGYL